MGKKLDTPNIISPSGNTINSSSITLTIRHPFYTNDSTGNQGDALSYASYKVYDNTSGSYLYSWTGESDYYGSQINSSRTLSGFTSGHTYTITVKVSPVDTNISSSNENSITVNYGQSSSSYTNPTAPTTINTSVTSNSITVSWSGATGGQNNPIYDYFIEWWKNGASTSDIQEVSSSPYTIQGLDSGTTYNIHIKTHGTEINTFSNWSSTVQATTNSTTPTITYGTCTIISFTINSISSATVVASGTNITGNWYYKLGTSSSAVSGNVVCNDNSGSSNNTFTINTTFIAGTTYYLRLSRQVISGATPADPEGGNSSTWTLSTNYKSTTTPAPTYGYCTAPTSVTCTRSRGSVTINWSGASGGTNNSISSYKIIRNTTASESGAVTINASFSSTSTSGNTTNAPGAGTYYYGVRTQGSAGSSYYSGFKWSSAITVPTHPTVNIGDTITKAQMDLLYQFINETSSTNAVTQNSTINASDGNTYNNSLTAGVTKITASWYNGA